MSAVPSLSVVMPVYNEPDWIGRSVASAAEAVRNSPFAGQAEIVIVDDGSEQPTKDAIAALDPGLPLNVVTQENSGRFRAREVGIRAATGDLVMLLDSRVLVEPGSLAFVAGTLDGGPLPAWNGHVEIDVRGNPFARFWRTIVNASWNDYLANPRHIKFGAEDFDQHPKGTTLFIAPRDLLLSALHRFETHFEDNRFANDDTSLLRFIAEERGINLAPGFGCVYHFGSDTLGGFLKHTYHRGTVFFDGYGRPGSRYFPALAAFFPVSLVCALIAISRPRLALKLAALGPLAAAAGAAKLRRPNGDIAAFAALSGPFAAAYGAGIWRGLLLAVRARLGGGS